MIMGSARVPSGLGRSVLAAAAAFALLAVGPADARAASGQLTYVRADTSSQDALFNPPNDVCLALPGGAVRAGNDTDATAFVYPDASCGQVPDLVGVGALWDAPTGTRALAVRFGSSAAPGRAGVR